MTRVWPSTTMRPVSSSTSSTKPVSCFRPASPAGEGAVLYWSRRPRPRSRRPRRTPRPRTRAAGWEAPRETPYASFAPRACRPASAVTPGDDSVELLADPLHVAALDERDLGDRMAVLQRGD